jgi:hypothetical protein
MLYTNVDKALRNQLQAALPKIYISAIINPIIGIGNTTCLAISTHNDMTHTGSSQRPNSTGTSTGWRASGTHQPPPTSIELLFAQINDGVAFATAGGDPPTGPSIIRIAYNIVATTGRFDVATREWRAKTAAQKLGHI